jgi:glycosyltransferase involved in cell wall biosynthesis
MQGDRPWSILTGLLKLVRLCVLERGRALFVAHLDASTLVLCLLKPLLGLRLFVMVHASPQQWPRWYRLAFRLAIHSADLVIGGGEQHRLKLVQEGVPSERIVLVGIGSRLLDEGAKPPDRDIRSELGIPAHAVILLNVARMVAGKGQSEILRAVALLQDRDVVAVIVGDGPEQEALQRLAVELGVAERVFFPGRRVDLNNFYGAASVFLMPCLDESMGVVILEALAYRLPIVAYDSGCISEFIRTGENGFLISPDAQALAIAIARVLGKPPQLVVEDSSRFSMIEMIKRFRGFCVTYGGFGTG